MRHLALLITAGLSLSACTTAVNMGITTNNSGGQTVTEFPVAAPISKLMTGNFTKVISLSNEGTISTITNTQTREGPVQIDNKAVFPVVSNIVMTLNGKPLTSATFTHYYSLDPLTNHASPDETNIDTVVMISTLPTVAAIGDSGEFAKSVIPIEYDDDLPQTAIQTWSLSKANQNTAWLCLHTTLIEPSSPEDVAAKECFEVTQSGDIVDMEVTVPPPIQVQLATITFS